MASPMDGGQCLGLLGSLGLSEFPESLYMLHYPARDVYLGYFSPDGGVSGVVCFSTPELAAKFMRYADDKQALITPVTLDEARTIAKDPKRPNVEALLLADDPWKPKALFVRAAGEMGTR